MNFFDIPIFYIILSICIMHYTVYYNILIAYIRGTYMNGIEALRSNFLLEF